MRDETARRDSFAGAAPLDPLVHVIVVNWNGWRDTVACLGSLGKLAYDNYRVLIVDNGSTDESVARIREAFPDADILETGRNLGFAGGNNIGIRRAAEQAAVFVWLVNNDTTADPGALSAMVKAAQSDSRIGMVGSVLYYMHDPDRVQAWGGARINLWWGTSRHFQREAGEDRIHYLTAASLLLRCRALEDTGLFDDAFFMYWEDTDLGFRFRNKGWRLAVAADSRLWHKETASLGRKNPLLDLYFNASFVRFFRKHAPFPALPIVIGTGARFARRLVNGEWARVGAVLRGACAGLTRP